MAAGRDVQVPGASIAEAALVPSIETLRSLLVLDAVTDPGTIHRARTATRRLRSNLRSIGVVLEAPREVRAELAWLGDALGDVRDTDVLSARLAAAKDEVPEGFRGGLAALRDEVAGRRAASDERLRADVASERFATLVHELELLVKEGATAADPLDARAVMRPRWRALRDAVDALGDPPTDADLHTVRIETKRLRYGAEIFRSVGGSRCRRCLRRSTRLQDALGDQHDAARAGDWLAGHALIDAEIAAAIGWLAARAATEREVGREAWRAPFHALARPKARFW
jgi:CHAD domain-containing protein